MDPGNSSGQEQTVAAPGDYTQTIDLIEGVGSTFSIRINPTNGTNGTFTINPGVTVSNAASTTVRLDAGASLSAIDVQGDLIATNFNAVNASSTSSIGTFSNSGVIRATRTGSSTLFLTGPIGTFTNSGTIEHTAASTALIIDNATTLTNASGGSITGANGAAIRFGFSNPAAIGSFVNNGQISGGGLGVQVGLTAGSTAGITNSGTITGVTDGLVVQNGSELSAFDNTGGVIQSTGAGGAGLHLSEDQDIAITNAGTLRSTSTGNGLLLDTEGQTRDFTNSGTISSTAGTAILAQAAMTGDTDGFVNTGTITGGGGTAIDARAAFKLTNSGTVTGHISHTAAGVLDVTHTGGSISGNITSTVDAAHTLTLNGGTITGNITLDGATANTFALAGTTITGNVDLGDVGAHSVSLSKGTISGSLDIGTGTTALAINAAGGDTVTIGTLATNNTTTTNISGAGAVNITNLTLNGTTNQSAGTLTATTLSVGTGGSFTQSGSSVLNVPSVTLNGTAILNLNGTTARVTGTITGGMDSQVFVNGTFTSENTINVGHFEIGSGGLFNMAHDVTVTSPTSFANNGTLAIGAGQTMTVTGNYTQGATGVLQTNAANGGSFGKLVVTGTASLPSNAKIDVNVTGSNFNFTAAELENVISAGTLSSDGTFSITDNSNLFDFQAAVSGNALDLCLVAAGGSCGSSSSSGVLNAVVANRNDPAVGAAMVFDDLIGSFAAGGTTGNSSMDSVIGALGSFATQKEVSDAVSQTLPLLTASAAIPVKNAVSRTHRIVQGRLSGDDWPRLGQALMDKHIWAYGFRAYHDHDDRKRVPGFDGHSRGLVIGIDGDYDDRNHLGLAFAYNDMDLDSNTRLNTADIKGYELIGYGRHALSDTIELDAQAGLGLSETKGERTLAFMGGAPTARSSYDSLSFHLGGGMARKIELNDATQFTPAMHIDYTRINSESYSESGAAALNLNTESSHLQALELGVSGKLGHRLNDKASLAARLGVAYDAVNEQPEVTSSFAGGGGAFVTRGLDPSPWIGRAGVDLPIALGHGAQIGLHYDAEAREDYNNQTVSVNFRLAL